MWSSWSLVGALLLPQLDVSPFPATVGTPVVVHAARGEQPIVGLAVQVELPDGATVSCGQTSASGEVRFVPTQPGAHVFRATIDGVRTLAPLAVVAKQSRWVLAFGTVPLGLALVWWNLSRARGRRGS